MLTIRQMFGEDFEGVAALQRACFPEPFPLELLWNPNHLRRHNEMFPQGQFVAILNSEVVASCTNILISNERWEAHLAWEDVTGGLMLSKHEPGGQTLYGIDISVHPDHRGKGIARQLYQMRFDLVRALDLSRYGTVCRMPDFSISGHADPSNYAELVVKGTMSDRTLTPLLKMGLTYEGVVSGYMDDEESGNAGAILSWQI